MPEMRVLADFSAEKIAQDEALVDLLKQATDGDLIRVVSIAFHEAMHRWPEKTIEQWVAAARQAVEDAHLVGFP